MNLKLNKNKKYLLAFSGGTDSSALFHYLLKNKYDFSIAIVYYGLRSEALNEFNHAKELADKNNIKIYTKKVDLLNQSNMEKKARDIRHSFFENIIYKYNFDGLITGHNLNDRLEWFLMRMSKGSGVEEALGMNEIDKRDDYDIYRPMLSISKDDIYHYLKKNNIKYFEDKSNQDNNYERNYIRNKFSNELITKFGNGFKKSFEYMNNDLNLIPKCKKEKLGDSYFKFKQLNDISNMRMLSKILKKEFNYVLTKNQQDDIINQEYSIVISGVIAIDINKYNEIYISPYIKLNNADKKFKNKCRINNIPIKIRGYLKTVKEFN